MQLTDAETNILIQGVYHLRGLTENRLHDDRTSDFEKKLNQESLDFFDNLLTKLKGN